MGISDRINGWVDDRRKVWGGALGNFLVGTIAESLKKSVGATAPTPNYVKDIIARYKERTGTPDDIRDFLSWLESMENTPIGWFFGTLIMMVQSLGIILGGSEPLANIIKYGQEFALRTQQLDPMQAITAWRRDNNYQPPPLDDLRRQGWSEERIEALKFVTEVIPNAADIVRFALREVYTPEIAEQYGQFQDIPTAAYPDAARAGLSEDMFKKYWAAHWGLPSASDGFELLHRGLLTEDQLKGLLKANDIMPYWRDQLIKLSWNVPTRVDVRRFWEMRTIDEARLREIYTALGYHGRDLDDYVLWTKIYTDFPDLLARYKNGWITIDDVKAELVTMGMKPERAKTLIQEKLKNATIERTVTEKNLTKADIVNGVKKGVITRLEGAELLVSIGYSTDEATYILDVSIPADEETSAKTKRELTKADILAGLKTGVLTELAALKKLLDLRYTSDDATFILKIYKASATPPAEPKLKEASKADIVTAVKKGLITPEDGYLMLLDLGFASDAANFILSVAAESSPFSPMSFGEFKDVADKWRKAAGLEVKPMSEELRKAADELVARRKDAEALRAAVAAEEKLLIPGPGLPATATEKLTELRAALHRAESELARVQTDYNVKVAEWKHAAK